MADKVIRVSEEVHQKVGEIAKANYRGYGDQVAYWADHHCNHPVECRQYQHVLVMPVIDATENSVAQVGAGERRRGFKCTQCGDLVITDLPEEVNALLNPSIEAVS